MRDGDEVIAMLVVPSEYVRYINEVAGLTTSDVIFVKRKFASRAGYELTKHPIDQCSSLAYFDERPVTTIASGVLLTAVIALIFVEVLLNWDNLVIGLKAMSLVGLGGIYGVQRMFGARRHRLVFTMQDQTKLTWASRAGEYRLWKQSAQQIVDYARTRRLLTTA